MSTRTHIASATDVNVVASKADEAEADIFESLGVEDGPTAVLESEFVLCLEDEGNQEAFVMIGGYEAMRFLLFRAVAVLDAACERSVRPA